MPITNRDNTGHLGEATILTGMIVGVASGPVAGLTVVGLGIAIKALEVRKEIRDNPPKENREKLTESGRGRERY